MKINLSKILVVLILASLVVPGTYLISGNSEAKAPIYSAAPSNHHIAVTITNNLSKPTPSPYDEMIVVNSSAYSFYENENLSNTWFSYPNGTVIPSWLQSGNSALENNTTYWLRLNQSIPATSSIQVYLNFGKIGSNYFNKVTTGEAPQLASPYALYDNGQHVFNFYDNFAGTSLNTSKWEIKGGALTPQVHNGITFTTSYYIVSKENFSLPSYVETYGIISAANDASATSYFLGGVGFSKGGYDGSFSSLSTGWAENDTNWLGLSLWDGSGGGPFSGAYTYNFSKSISPNAYHVFGTGFINNTYNTGLINDSIQNVTRQPLGLSPNEKLNVTLGFQSGNSPVSDHFYWIFERNSTYNGQPNLPYQVVKQSYTVTFVPKGLSNGASWSASVNGTTKTSPGGNITFTLINGTYNAVLSATNGYLAYPQTLNFEVKGNTGPFFIQFESLKNQTKLTISSTIFNSLSQSVPGFYQNTTTSLFDPNSTFTMAIDQKTNVLYSLTLSGSVVSRNLTSGAVTKMPAIPEASSIQYDSYSNNLFVPSAYTGNLTIINASTMKITGNLSLPWIQYSFSSFVTLSQVTSNGQEYVMTLNNTLSNGAVNVEVISPYGKLVSNSTFNNINQSYIAYGFAPPIYGGNIILTNYTGIWILDPLTGSSKFIKAPEGFTPEFAIQLGNSQNFVVGNASGGKNSSQEYIFNFTTQKYSPYEFLGGIPLSGAYDNTTGIQYMEVSDYSNVYNASIIGFYPGNGTIVASAPDPAPEVIMAFDANNQNIYAMSFALFSSEPNAVYVYSPQKAYNVIFKESGLPNGSSWFLKVNGITHDLSSSSFTETSTNGTIYSFTAENTSQDYASPYSGIETINGAVITVSIDYLHWAYIYGNFTQTGIDVSINGVQIGSGNISLYQINQTVAAGSYVVKIYGSGYVTQYENFTLSPGQSMNISTSLKVQSTPPGNSGLPGIEIYAAIGGVLAVIAVAGGVFAFRRRK